MPVFPQKRLIRRQEIGECSAENVPDKRRNDK